MAAWMTNTSTAGTTATDYYYSSTDYGSTASTDSTIWIGGWDPAGTSSDHIVTYTTSSNIIYREPVYVRPPAIPERWIEEIRRREPEPTIKMAAVEKSLELLRDIIGEELWTLYRQRGHVDIPSAKKPGITYRVRPKRMIGIVENGREQKRSLCIHPKVEHPKGDEAVAQIMLCRHDEDLLWSMANEHRMAA